MRCVVQLLLMVCVCVPPFTGEFEFSVGSSLSLVVDIMNLLAIGRPAALLARQNCQRTAFLKRKSNVSYVKNHETSNTPPLKMAIPQLLGRGDMFVSLF